MSVAERLIAKLRSKKLHPVIIDVLISWLRNRKAYVVVGGQKSECFDLTDMVFQGTVLGTPLWNVFYEDANRAIHKLHYTEVVYADDLNAFLVFPASVPNKDILKNLATCQTELHEWGYANQVAFDPQKESVHIPSKTDAPWPAIQNIRRNLRLHINDDKRS